MPHIIIILNTEEMNSNVTFIKKNQNQNKSNHKTHKLSKAKNCVMNKLVRLFYVKSDKEFVTRGSLVWSVHNLILVGVFST